MIDESGRAVLADPSPFKIIPDQSTYLSSSIDNGTVRWISPELLDPDKYGLEKSRPTRESDCYALGMVIYEVLSGRTPYGRNRPYIILFKVLGGERPERPKGEDGRLFTDRIWDMVRCCWEPQPSERAKAKDVLACLEGNPPTVDEEVSGSDTAEGSSECGEDDEIGLLEGLEV